MKIARVDLYIKSFRLKAPSAVAYATVEDAPHVFVRIETESGLEGWGCCAPDPVVTGETVEAIHDFLDRKGRDLLMQRDARRLHALDSHLARHGPEYPGARAAVNIALYDLLGKRCGRPVYELLGFYRQCMATSITLCLDTPGTMAEKARGFVAKGFSVLKVKLGGDLEEDLARVRSVREAAGEAIALRLDANQAYTATGALKLCEALSGDARIEFLEQPTPAGDLAGLGETARGSAIPIMADESVVSPADALAVAQNRAAQSINIKLMKAGGITAALKIAGIAEAAGLPAMLGCMDESVLSIAAALHLALACENVAWADLDGHLDIEADAASGGVRLEKGILYPLDEPGFGVKIDRGRL
jgi:L-alanine-DL-glutamate epimerase-like enolase superfamily enzyme